MEDLSDEQKELIEKSIKDFTAKCLMSFGKTCDAVIQKMILPRVLLHGQTDHVPEAERRVLEEVVYKIVSEAINNHSEVLARTIDNTLKTVLAGFPHQQQGPVYFNQPKTNNGERVNGDGSVASPSQQPSGGSGNNFNTTGVIPMSAQKIVSSAPRFIRGVDYYLDPNGQPQVNNTYASGFIPVTAYQAWGHLIQLSMVMLITPIR